MGVAVMFQVMSRGLLNVNFWAVAYIPKNIKLLFWNVTLIVSLNIGILECKATDACLVEFCTSLLIHHKIFKA